MSHSKPRLVTKREITQAEILERRAKIQADQSDPIKQQIINIIKADDAVELDSFLTTRSLSPDLLIGDASLLIIAIDDYDTPKKEIINLLLQRGCNVNSETQSNSTALHYAAKKGYPEIIKKLLASGANPDVSNLGYQTPLFMACRCKGKNYEAATEALLAHWRTAIEDAESVWSPIVIATVVGALPQVKMLVEHGASLKPRKFQVCIPLGKDGQPTNDIPFLYPYDKRVKPPRGVDPSEGEILDFTTENARYITVNGASLKALAEVLGHATLANYLKHLSNSDENTSPRSSTSSHKKPKFYSSIFAPAAKEPLLGDSTAPIEIAYQHSPDRSPRSR